ncbi:chorismate mutase [Paenibacillus turpanensis]|uniref:chorismate mutase n=1 Tax=Paenibacillus turpanensis TaxID=2689078 RepID=UPI001408A4CB|nr:chorismate mutase [Paenibacillus turpanensis]
MMVRGIRGAITVERNAEEDILQATSQLLDEIVQANGVVPDEIASVFITVTHDLDAAFPAGAIRKLSGWELVPLMCSMEIPVQNSLPMCIRFMVMVNTTKGQDEIKHIYMNRAKALRPDLSKEAK